MVASGGHLSVQSPQYKWFALLAYKDKWRLMQRAEPPGKSSKCIKSLHPSGAAAAKSPPGIERQVMGPWQGGV